MPAGGLPPPSEEEEDAASSGGRGAVFVLENASLETAKVGKARLQPPDIVQATTAQQMLPAESC